MVFWYKDRRVNLECLHIELIFLNEEVLKKKCDLRNLKTV